MSKAEQQGERFDLDEQCYLEYYESFFDQTTSDAWLKELTDDSFPWERQTIMGVLTKRSNAWFADDASLIYRYSGQTWVPHSFTPTLTAICEQLELQCDCQFNAVLAALYPDGSAGVNWHDDNDFPELPDTPIVTVSFGSERRFKVRRKTDRKVVAEYDISHGSVVVMGGAMQRHYDHALMKTSRKVAPRVNLSYRNFPAEVGG